MTDTVRTITQSTFAEDVVAADRPVLVDFYADWCAPCRMIAPVVEDLSAQLGDRLDFVKVDVDRNRELAATYAIRGLPTLMLFTDGKPVETVVGVASKDDLISTIEPHV